jgi:hypothetical protein
MPLKRMIPMDAVPCTGGMASPQDVHAAFRLTAPSPRPCRVAPIPLADRSVRRISLLNPPCHRPAIATAHSTRTEAASTIVAPLGGGVTRAAVRILCALPLPAPGASSIG